MIRGATRPSGLCPLPPLPLSTSTSCIMENAEAGPSNISISQSQPPLVTGVEPAPPRPLPSTHFYSIEYPGYVKPTSVPLALERLGGQQNVERAFKRGGSKSECTLELSMRPGIPFTHPLPGEVLPASNIVLKVVKRKLKKKLNNNESGVTGEYKVEAVGVVTKSARFRSRSPQNHLCRAYMLIVWCKAWQIISLLRIPVTLSRS